MNTQLWSAVHTPFLKDGSLDEEGIRHNVEGYIDRGLYGIFINGLMGENWAVPTDDRVEIARIIADQSKGRLKVCAVATLNNEPDTIDLGLRYKEAGLDYVCFITPERRQTDDHLVECFNRLMDAVDMPTVIFNAITPTGSILTPELFAQICENPHVRILKTTASDEVNNSLRAVAREDVLVSDPTEEKFFTNATEQGQRILFADPEPYLYQTPTFRPIEKYARLIEEGRIDEAREIFDALAPLRVEYNKWMMICFYRGIRINAYLKKWASMNGLVGGYVRDPLTELNPVETLAMETDITAAYERVHAALGDEVL